MAGCACRISLSRGGGVSLGGVSCASFESKETAALCGDEQLLRAHKRVHVLWRVGDGRCNLVGLLQVVFIQRNVAWI